MRCLLPPGRATARTGWMSRLLSKEGDPDMDLRDYGIGAQVLAGLGIHDMELLTNAKHTLVALSGYGLNVVGERAIPEGLD